MITHTKSNLEHTQFRQLSTTQGRWLSPDPAGMAAVDLTNPQSLNMYAYVMNGPMEWSDPLGLQPLQYVPAVEGNNLGGVLFVLHGWQGEYTWWDISFTGGPGSGGGGGGGGGGNTNSTPPRLTVPTCVNPAVFAADQTHALQTAYETSQLGAYLLNKTVGVGFSVGGGFGVGDAFGAIGAQASISAGIFSDASGQSAIVASLETPGPASMARPNTNVEYGLAANVGVQITITSQSIQQLAEADKIAASIATGPIAVDTNLRNRISVTVGAGFGARIGGGINGAPPPLFLPICKVR